MKSKTIKEAGMNAPGPKDMIRMYATILFIVMMLFGILLLPSTQVMAHDKGLIEEITAGKKLSTYTPFVNNEFIFYWSPIDPLYEQADTEINCPWGIENGLNDDDNNGQTNDEDRRGITFYGDSYISNEGVIAIGSYDKNNKITVTLEKGHLFTENFKSDFPENTIHSWEGNVFNGDKNNNGRADRYDQNSDRSYWNIDVYDPARAPLNS
ncbi:MAG: hypothetical protein KAJ51_03325, partial [Thermoplasmata archaeon]|nr:hypothetical protein [Thermoplasmata archaeon]